MKRRGIWLLIWGILAICSLAACSPGGSDSDRLNCSSGGEVCITINPVQPMHFADPVTVTIKVTSSKDISDLWVLLHTPAGVLVDGPRSWEKDLSSTFHERGMASWNFAIKAGQTLTFTRVLHFPVPYGYVDVSVRVTTFDQTLAGIDSFAVHTAHDEKFYKMGTPVPVYTPDVTMAVYGPGTPFPTPLPPQPEPWETTPLPADNTPIPALGTSPTPATQIVPLVATSTPLTSPYPPPPYP